MERACFGRLLFSEALRLPRGPSETNGLQLDRPTNRPTDMRRNTREHCRRMFWYNRLEPCAITVQMRIQSDPLLLCSQEPFIKSRLPTLPAKQIQVDQIVLNLVTHDSFEPASARKGAQNISVLLKRLSGEKVHLNRRVGVASHFNKIAGGSLAEQS